MIQLDIGKSLFCDLIYKFVIINSLIKYYLSFRFLQSVLLAAEEYEVISRDLSLSEEEKSVRAAALTVEGAAFEQLALTMTHVAAHADPSVSVQPLCDSGEHIEVNVVACVIVNALVSYRRRHIAARKFILRRYERYI